MCERSCVHECFREITEPHRQTYTDTLGNYHVFIFVNLQLAGRECFPLLSLALHGREAAAASRKSSGKPLMDNYATTPRPQHLAPLSFLLHKNNNKQVDDPAVRFCHSFPTVGAAVAEKISIFPHAYLIEFCPSGAEMICFLLSVHLTPLRSR